MLQKPLQGKQSHGRPAPGGSLSPSSLAAVCPSLCRCRSSCFHPSPPAFPSCCIICGDFRVGLEGLKIAGGKKGGHKGLSFLGSPCLGLILLLISFSTWFCVFSLWCSVICFPLPSLQVVENLNWTENRSSWMCWMKHGSHRMYLCVPLWQMCQMLCREQG